MVDKISSLDKGYFSGALSNFPEAKDNWDSLFKATNNSETTLKMLKVEFTKREADLIKLE